MPRLSVDIDLTYLPLDARGTALPAIDSAFDRMVMRANETLRDVDARRIGGGGDGDTRFMLRTGAAEVKVEVSPVARGTVAPPRTMRVTDTVEDAFGFAEMSVVAFEDLYAGKLCAALDIPIAGTETTRGGPWGVAQAIAFNAVDIVRADVSWKAGVTGTLKIAHLAEAHGMRCEIHCTTMGFMDMANLHVSCAIKNCEYFELLIPEEPFRFPMKDKYPIDKHGIAHVPQKSGIGVELDWDAIDRTSVEHRITKLVPHDIMPVARVSKPAVSPNSKSAALTTL
jgi:hypothetical protein